MIPHVDLDKPWLMKDSSKYKNMTIIHLEERRITWPHAHVSYATQHKDNMSVLMILRKRNNTAKVSWTDPKERAQSFAQKRKHAQYRLLFLIFNLSCTSTKETPYKNNKLTSNRLPCFILSVKTILWYFKDWRISIHLNTWQIETILFSYVLVWHSNGRSST